MKGLQQSNRIVVILLLLGTACFWKGSCIQIRTASGLLNGNIVENGSVLEFLNIPYVQEQPVGENRFSRPQMMQSWGSEVLDATKLGVACIQYPSAGLFAEGEDCLQLNIWTPIVSNSDSQLLPVMVWIHGGGFSVGSAIEGLYNGSLLAAASAVDEGEGVVVVSINYRLGFLGFPALGFADDAPLGFLDQQVALQWLQKNIASFGGDPSRVTIFGESAGGLSVAVHMVAPDSMGLFSRAIAESGMSLKLKTLSLVQSYTVAGAAAAGCPQADSTGRLACLRGLDAKNLTQDTFLACPVSWHCYSPYVSPSGPIVEQPIDSLNSGRFAKNVPLMAGFNKNDSTFVQFAMIYGYRPPQPFTMDDVQKLFAWYGYNEESQMERIVDEYSATFATYGDNFTAASAATTDALFSSIEFRYAALMEAMGGAQAYIYRFDYLMSLFPKALPVSELGVCHLSELTFIFGRPCFASCEVPYFVGTFDATDLVVVSRMQQLWLDFARGVPVIMPQFGPDYTNGPVTLLPGSNTVPAGTLTPMPFWTSMPICVF